MKNNFLKDLVENHVSIESAHESEPELLELAIESSLKVIGNLDNLITSLESNIEFHFGGSETVSLEAYRNYEASVDLILKANGIQLPVDVFVPSFESEETSKGKAEAKKDNVVVRAWKAFWAAVLRLVNWIKDLFRWKRSKVVKPNSELITKKLAEVRAAIQAFTPDGKPRSYRFTSELYSESYKEAAKSLDELISDQVAIVKAVRTIATGLPDFFDNYGRVSARWPITIEKFKDSVKSVNPDFRLIVEFAKEKALADVGKAESEWKKVRSDSDKRLAEIEKSLNEFKSINPLFFEINDHMNEKKRKKKEKETGSQEQRTKEQLAGLRKSLGNLINVTNNGVFRLIDIVDEIVVESLNHIHKAAEPDVKPFHLALPAPKPQPADAA